MEIEDVVIQLVTVPTGDEYYRFNSETWFEFRGESLEPVFDCEWLEKWFNEWFIQLVIVTICLRMVTG